MAVGDITNVLAVPQARLFGNDGHFIVAGENGFYVSADDGITWALTSPPFTGSLASAGAYLNGAWVVVTLYDGSFISLDGGINWQACSVNGNPSWQESILVHDGAFYLAPLSRLGGIYRSTDGVDWALLPVAGLEDAYDPVVSRIARSSSAIYSAVFYQNYNGHNMAGLIRVDGTAAELVFSGYSYGDPVVGAGASAANIRAVRGNAPTIGVVLSDRGVEEFSVPEGQTPFAAVAADSGTMRIGNTPYYLSDGAWAQAETFGYFNRVVLGVDGNFYRSWDDPALAVSYDKGKTFTPLLTDFTPAPEVVAGVACMLCLTGSGVWRLELEPVVPPEPAKFWTNLKGTIET